MALQVHHIHFIVNVATFSKNERLCSETLINRLFDRKSVETDSFARHPVRLVWLPVGYLPQGEDSPAQILFSVPKRHFKRAVARNVVRRRLKEAWRAQKDEFYVFLKELNLNLALAVIYQGKEELDYHTLHKQLSELLVIVKKILKKKALSTPS